MPAKKIAIIIDPLERIHIDKDTTFALALESKKRGFENHVVFLEDIFQRDSVPWCHSRQIDFVRDNPCYQWISPPASQAFDEFDFVLIRKDPPFDEAYFFATHFLSFCKKAVILNHPQSLREAPEKLYAFNFPQVLPPTLITSKAEEIRSFMEEQGGEIIIKPLNQCGGLGVLYLTSQDKNFNSLIEISTKEGREWIMAQKYLPEIKQGDKRIILINGEAKGAISRIPAAGELRGNIHAGGQVLAASITQRDHWLVEQISARLKKDGLYLVGLDVIGDYITEINVTSPTGIQEIEKLAGINLASLFWDEIDKFRQ